MLNQNRLLSFIKKYNTDLHVLMIELISLVVVEN